MTQPNLPYKLEKNSSALQLDSLLSSEIGQKLFFGNPNSSNYSPVTKNPNSFSNLNIKPSPSFISQSRNSKIPNSFTPSAKKININQSFDKAHKEIVTLNERMKSLETKYKDDYKALESRVTPQRRRQIAQSIKETQNNYKVLKDNRLKVIKQERILKNQYPEGLNGYELFY